MAVGWLMAAVINKVRLEVQTERRMIQNQLKEGTVVTYQVLQNTTTYQVRLTNTAKGLWMCIEESGLNWKLTVSQEMVDQTVSKASASQQVMTIKEFTNSLLQAISKTSDRWGLGIMTPVELEVLRGGTPSKQANNNKVYLILSDKDKKFHYPFTFVMSQVGEKERMVEAIKTMKTQLEELKVERSDKSQSSFSIMSDTYNTSEQTRIENEELKKKIRMYEESLTQKRGAVEIDLILKEKNNLEIKAETKKREENKEITRLRNIFHLMGRDIKEVENDVEVINRELLMFEDSVGNAAKIKSHAMKVLKSYEAELRTQKKVQQKQGKELDTHKRNIMNSKNNERKVLGKIKQIQMEIDQCKKKANIKEISNRLHSVGKGRNGSSVDSGSSKSQSIGGNSMGRAPHSDTAKRGNVNLVRENILRKNMPLSSSNRNNNLLRTSPNMAATDLKKHSSDKVSAGRAINSSHQIPNTNARTGTNPRLYNTQKYRSGSKSENENSSVRSNNSKKKECTPEEKERQRKAMERLTGGPKAMVPRGPSADKKVETGNRLNSQNRGGSSSINKAGSVNKPGSLSKPNATGNKKDSAKELLLKMKQIKAHYSNQAKTNTSKNIVNKISELSDKNI